MNDHVSMLQGLLADYPPHGFTAERAALNAAIAALQSQQVASADRGEAVAWRIQPKEWNRPPILTRFAEDAEEMRELGATVTPLYAATPPSPAESAEGAMTVDEWAELYRLREDAKGPDGFGTWKDAAVAERVRRVEAERALASAAPSGVSDAMVRAAQDAYTARRYANADPRFGPPTGLHRPGADETRAMLEAALACQPQPGRVEGMDQ